MVSQQLQAQQLVPAAVQPAVLALACLLQALQVRQPAVHLLVVLQLLHLLRHGRSTREAHQQQQVGRVLQAVWASHLARRHQHQLLQPRPHLLVQHQGLLQHLACLV